jgi:hypothetical protein
MPEIVIELLEIPEVREGLLDFFLWLLSESQRDPVFQGKFSALVAQLRDPGLTIEVRQDVLRQLQTLHPVS